jgi:hypothetical protein
LGLGSVLDLHVTVGKFVLVTDGERFVRTARNIDD